MQCVNQHHVCFVYFYCYLALFFVKQKTAYEMRISDWSSDVCSSDLLSQLRRQTASANHVESLRTLLSTAGGNAEARLYLNLALAKEYEDLGQYPLAFEHLGAGKSSHRDSRRYAFARDQALFDALMHATPVPAAGAVGNDSDEPIFVIDRKSTGKTLGDRILSSHPQMI